MPSRQATQVDREASRTAFRDYLKDKGIKLTRARRDILEMVLSLQKHFEAEELLYALRDAGCNVGKATVYRTIPLLVECGILKQVRFDVQQAHYERVFGEKPHDHMVCRDCGRIVEFSSQDIIELRDRIGREHGFHVSSHRFQLAGTCADCAARKPLDDWDESR